MRITIEPASSPTPQSYSFDNFPVGIWMEVISDGYDCGTLLYKVTKYSDMVGIRDNEIVIWWGRQLDGYSFVPAKSGTKIVIEV